MFDTPEGEKLSLENTGKGTAKLTVTATKTLGCGLAPSLRIQWISSVPKSALTSFAQETISTPSAVLYQFYVNACSYCSGTEERDSGVSRLEAKLKMSLRNVTGTRYE